MIVLFYKSVCNENSDNLQKAIEQALGGGPLEVHPGLDSLLRRVRQSSYGQVIVVLLAGTRHHLARLIALRDQLKETRIILILPDRTDETIARGHTLYPRFLSYLDSNFDDVSAVLRKLLSAFQSCDLKLVLKGI